LVSSWNRLRQRWLGGAGAEGGDDAEVGGGPGAHVFEDGDEVVAGEAEAVVDAGRDGRLDGSEDEAIGFELAELGGEDLLADAPEEIAEFAEAVGLEGEVPEDEDLPLAGEDVGGGLDGTAVMGFHRIPFAG